MHYFGHLLQRIYMLLLDLVQFIPIFSTLSFYSRYTFLYRRFIFRPSLVNRLRRVRTSFYAELESFDLRCKSSGCSCWYTSDWRARGNATLLLLQSNFYFCRTTLSSIVLVIRVYACISVCHLTYATENRWQSCQSPTSNAFRLSVTPPVLHISYEHLLHIFACVSSSL